MKLQNGTSQYELNLSHHLEKLNQDIILNSQWKNKKDNIESKLLEPKIKMMIEDKDTLIAYLQMQVRKYQNEVQEKENIITNLKNEIETLKNPKKNHSHNSSISDSSDSTFYDEQINDYKKKYLDIKERYDSLEIEHTKLIENYSECLKKIDEDKETINNLSLSFMNKRIQKNKKVPICSIKSRDYSMNMVSTEPNDIEENNFKRKHNGSFLGFLKF